MTWAPASLGLSGLLTGWIPRQLLFLVGNAMNSILILFIYRYQSNFSPSMRILAHWQMRAKLLNETVQWNAYHIAIFWGDTVAKYNVFSRRSQKIGLKTTKSSFIFSFFLPWRSSPKLWSEKKTGKCGSAGVRMPRGQWPGSPERAWLGWGWGGAAQQRRAEGREGAHWKAESTWVLTHQVQPCITNRSWHVSCCRGRELHTWKREKLKWTVQLWTGVTSISVNAPFFQYITIDIKTCKNSWSWVYIYNSSSHDFLSWISFSIKKNQGSIAKWVILGLRRGKYNKVCHFYSN